jgi:hypothetical protein
LFCICRCRHYVYADMSRFPSARGEEAYTGDDSSEKSQMFENIDLMRELETSSMAWLDDYQVTASWYYYYRKFHLCGCNTNVHAGVCVTELAVGQHLGAE